MDKGLAKFWLEILKIKRQNAKKLKNLKRRFSGCQKHFIFNWSFVIGKTKEKKSFMYTLEIEIFEKPGPVPGFWGWFIDLGRILSL